MLVLGTVRKPAGWSRGRSLEIWLERLVEVGSRRASVRSLGFILGGRRYHWGFAVVSMWRPDWRLESGPEER